MNVVYMLSYDVLMSLITQLPNWPPIYHKTVRMFPTNLSMTKLTSKKSQQAMMMMKMMRMRMRMKTSIETTDEFMIVKAHFVFMLNEPIEVFLDEFVWDMCVIK